MLIACGGGTSDRPPAPTETPVPPATAVVPTVAPTMAPTDVPTTTPEPTPIPFSLDLTEPLETEVFSESGSLTVAGRTRVDAEVTVGGITVEPNAEGEFSVEVSLEKGPNVIDVTASVTGQEHKEAVLVAFHLTKWQCAVIIIRENGGSYIDLTAEQQALLKEECSIDAEPPTIEITSPASVGYLTAGGKITITADAEDDVSVPVVTVKINGESYPTLLKPPYSFEYEIPPDQSSPFTVEMIAFDEAGHTASDSLSVSVRRDPPPKVTITSPLEIILTEGLTFTLSADAVDNGSVASVDFMVDREPKGSLTSPPYSIEYTVPTFQPGVDPLPVIFRVYVTATDTFGNAETEAASIAVKRASSPETASETETVIEQESGPPVRIVTPTVDAEVHEGDALFISAMTNDGSDVASVHFSVGDKMVNVNNAPFNYVYLVPVTGDIAAPKRPPGSPNPIPSIFGGTAFLDGGPAPEGTIVAVYIVNPKASTLVITVTAETKSGLTSSTSLTLDVLGAPLDAGEDTVKNGKFTLAAWKPSGYSFEGNLVGFTVGGKTANETGIWRSGQIEKLDLHAD